MLRSRIYYDRSAACRAPIEAPEDYQASIIVGRACRFFQVVGLRGRGSFFAIPALLLKALGQHQGFVFSPLSRTSLPWPPSPSITRELANAASKRRKEDPRLRLDLRSRRRAVRSLPLL
jgi:hypothetical protein